MPARQAYTGIHRQKAGRASQPARDSSSKQHSTTQTQALRMYLYLCIFCMCVSVCFVHSFARYVSLACSLYVRKAEATAQHNAHTHTQPTYVCIWLWHWPGPAFIVCVAEQKFCCSLYEHTATVAAAAAARASSWTVAGHMQRWWWGRGGVRPTATSTEYGRLPAWLALRQTVCSALSCS